MAKKVKEVTTYIGNYTTKGSILIEIEKGSITITAKQWDSIKPSERPFQSGIPFAKTEFKADGSVHSGNKAWKFLNSLTNHIYAEELMDWMEENSKFKKPWD